MWNILRQRKTSKKKKNRSSIVVDEDKDIKKYLETFCKNRERRVRKTTAAPSR